ncbi:hypothetical protein PLESTB_001318000 [Pleodorina starrii]|uniref:Sulfotransferase n=1 Tax=Pleodorina starrii TaxID=330485 RepID=A0A9W6BTU0_9CHLO|nr:hypothetical protein PLESTM_001764500 [Pleodorina starrii]GLC58097.1 hypothetical protein PLESTB_001318000 [Pleodorina starrii]
MDVQVSSFGGVGSTQLSNHLNAYGITTNLLTDSDNLRHCPRPPEYPPEYPPVAATAAAAAAAAGEATAAAAGAAGAASSPPSDSRPRTTSRPRHVVYLYGDPLAAVASHYRRGQACHQAQKTSGNPTALSPATFPASLEDYVARGEDLFGLQEHFHSWRTQPRDYPIVMLRYERMFEPAVASELFRLLCSHKLTAERLEEMAAAFVASRRPRRSQVPGEMYDRMYGDLLAAMDRLPPLYVRQPASEGTAR